MAYYWDGQNVRDEKEPVCVEAQVLGSGDLIQSARVVSGAPEETYALEVLLTDRGVEELAQIAGSNRFKRLAMIRDGKILIDFAFVGPLVKRKTIFRGIGSAAFGFVEIVNNERQTKSN